MRRTAPGRVLTGVGNKLSSGVNHTAAQITVTTDQLERSLNPELRAPLRTARKYNPLAVFGFLTKKLKDDPVVLTGYGAVSTLYANAKTATMLKAGVAPGLMAAFRVAATMVDITVVTLREHQRRDDPNRSFYGTLKNIGEQYAGYTEERRVENREFANEKDRRLSNVKPTANPESGEKK